MAFLKDYQQKSPEKFHTIKVEDANHIQIKKIDHDRIQYTVAISKILKFQPIYQSLCGIKVTSNSENILGFFCEAFDKTGFKQALFGFPGDFFMGKCNTWIEPIYPIQILLAQDSQLQICFTLENTCDFPIIEIRMCSFIDISKHPYPQVFVYKTRKNGEDCAVVGGIYYPARGFIPKSVHSNQNLPASYKIIPSFRILSNGWKDTSLEQSEFATFKELEDAIANDRFGGGFVPSSDYDKDYQEHVQ